MFESVITVMKYYHDLLDAIFGLKKRGYNHDLDISLNGHVCINSSMEFKADEFAIDEFYKFEGMFSIDDISVIYAISLCNGVKGLLIDAYGECQQKMSVSLLKKFTPYFNSDESLDSLIPT